MIFSAGGGPGTAGRQGAVQVEPRSTWELGADGLARLLSIGEDHELPDDPASVDELTGEALRKRLAGPVPFGPMSTADVVLCCSAASPTVSARSLGEMLLDPGVDVAVLERIKSWAKRLADRERRRRGRAPEYAVALTIYYAAAAAALAFHGQKITDYSFGELAGSLDMLIGKPWMAPAASELLTEARRICQERGT